LTEKQLAAATFGFAWGLAEPGPMFLGAQLSPGQDVDKARAELLAAIDGLATEPVTGEELERVRKQWLNAWELGFTDPERVGVALSDAIARGDWRLFFLDRNHVRAVAVEDINRVAAQYLKRDNRTLATYLPVTQTDRAPAPARVDPAAALKDFRGDATAAQVESFDPTPENLDARTQLSTLPSGLKLALLPKGARGGVVHARLALRFGDAQTLQGFSTVSGLGASLVDKGGAGLSRQQIRDRLDALRAQVGVGASDQGWSVNITTVRQHLPEVVRLVGQLLREPAFPAEALEEVRRQALSSLEQGRKEPGAVVADVLARHGNPYPRGDLRHAPSFEEREQDLKAVTVTQLRDFHRRFLSAAHGQFSAVGDFDAVALRESLTAALGDWTQPAAGPARYARAPRPLTAVAPERFVLRTPDKQRANLQAQLALPLNDQDADHVALLVGNFILGGNPASRLWARVREKEGLSYDVRSFIGWNPVDRNSTWTATAIFAPESQPRVEAAMKEEIARLLREGIGAQELAQAQQALLNQRRLSRAQDPVVASGWQFNLEHARTFAQARRLDDQIAAVTVEQVNAALRRHLDPSRIVWAWAGDFKKP
jgi:zinc protease